jgi:APA family basic amino acid/polyamine antiporter
MSAPPNHRPELVRGLGAWDGALLTIGSVLGTGIFITTGDIARTLPHGGLILLVWFVGGLLTLAGALTYSELGGMFPRAGGQYHFLKEAYGPLWGFLFGWTAFFVIMTGGIATLAVGFGEYLGAYLPFFSTRNVLFTLPLGAFDWSVNGGQLAGAMAIVLLSAVNYIGLKEGAGLQNAVTLVKVASLLGLAAFGLLVRSPVQPDLLAPPPSGDVLAAFGVGMIAVLWSFDGWYAVTSVAGEMRRPERNLPLGLIGGTAAVTLLYVLMNLVYIRALPVAAMGETGRIGEAAATALFGPIGGRLITAAVLISAFGCISATILYAARIYLPMAQEGVFFPALARIHPRYLTPSACIAAQGAWATLLTFSGSYEQLYTYVTFAVVLFHAATGAAVLVLRRTRPDAARPYRVWGYPWVPLAFILSSVALVLNTLFEKPVESMVGLVLVLLGVPAYAWWRARAVPSDAALPARGGAR